MIQFMRIKIILIFIFLSPLHAVDSLKQTLAPQTQVSDKPISHPDKNEPYRSLCLVSEYDYSEFRSVGTAYHPSTCSCNPALFDPMTLPRYLINGHEFSLNSQNRFHFFDYCINEMLKNLEYASGHYFRLKIQIMENPSGVRGMRLVYESDKPISNIKDILDGKHIRFQPMRFVKTSGIRGFFYTGLKAIASDIPGIFFDLETNHQQFSFSAGSVIETGSDISGTKIIITVMPQPPSSRLSKPELEHSA
ncbi:MAG: hypothetical protein JW774_01055 [Candidatus Aureabacteria bacterium]|nr:hypothetical protein [Candidatus Auribacterota bacterium]